MELNLDTFALPPLIDDVVKTIEPLVAKSGNQLCHCAADMGTMQADQMRLRQALLNLMSNANSSPNAAPSASMRVTGRRTVAVGLRWPLRIPASDYLEQMGKLFQEFSQASSRRPANTAAPALVFDQPTVLSDDGRRHHGQKRARPWIDFHDPPTEGRGNSEGRSGPRSSPYRDRVERTPEARVLAPRSK